LNKIYKNDKIQNEVERMIDLTKARKAFKEYVKNYNPEDKQVKLKITHIERTAVIARKIAEKLELEKEDIELAELIGLLHDIGRFEQIRRFHTFSDRDSINHGKFGVQVLFEQNLIRDFIEDNQYDEIIRKAILNHNRAGIEEGLSERELLHARLIKDADKTDIFYTLTFDDIKAIYGTYDFSNDKISDEVYREFMEEKRIDYSKRKGPADVLVSHFKFVYNFYFNYGLQYVYDQGYIDDLYKRFSFKDEETSKRYENVYKTTKQYVENKLNI